MKKNIFNSLVSSKYEGSRIDKFLQSQISELSRTRLQSLIRDGKVKLNNSVIINSSKKWKLLLNKVKLSANKKHNFQNKLMKNKKINYIKINIFPDGGISRIRAFGKIN